jgi:hypothetical protein
VVQVVGWSRVQRPGVHPLKCLLACRHDVLLRRVQVGQRTDEAAQHPGDVIDALDCSEGLAVPRHPGARYFAARSGLCWLKALSVYSRTISMFDPVTVSLAMTGSFHRRIRVSCQ